MYDGQYPKTKRMSKDQLAELTATVVRMFPRDLEEKIAQGWIDNPKLVKKAIHNAFVPPPSQPRWGIEETIKLGTYKKLYQLRQALRGHQFRVRAPTIEIMKNDRFTLSPSEKEVNVILLTAQELELFGDPKAWFGEPINRLTLEELVEAGRKFGLKPCPAEVGPQLRLQLPYRVGYRIRIVMEPIEIQPYGPVIFELDRNQLDWHMVKRRDPEDAPFCRDGRGSCGATTHRYAFVRT